MKLITGEMRKINIPEFSFDNKTSLFLLESVSLVLKFVLTNLSHWTSCSGLMCIYLFAAHTYWFN